MKYYKKSKRDIAIDKNVKDQVSEIIEDIRKFKDKSILKYNIKFDNNQRDNLRISREEIKKAYEDVDEKFIDNLRIAAENIEKFARLQKENFNDFEKEIYPGVILGQKNIPINSALAYVPGGGYPLFSTALMLIIPARIAGVERICACSPTMKNCDQINPKTLVAMDIAGANEIYAFGGIQSIAAFTYGTDSIKPVDIIVGPGNKYVTEAKRQCYGDVGIDFVAGPSEVLIMADESANPLYIAADLLAQCEHDYSARGILVTNSEALAIEVEKNINILLETLPTREVAQSAWFNNGEIIIVDNINQALDICNDYAPEHLEVNLKDSEEVINKLKNYGSLFIGENSAEVFGDYVSGTNHTLPTLRAARYTGGVWVGTFIKTCTNQRLSKKAVESLGPIACALAEDEGLYGHANAAKVRNH